MKKTTGLPYLAAIALSFIATQGGPAHAMPPGVASSIPAVAGEISAVEQAQFVWGGRDYCFYPDGWHGPGWYWCGYAFRRGLGWGGPHGWHNWEHGGGRGGLGPRRHGPPSRPHSAPHHR